jgi:hypothetical protein
MGEAENLAHIITSEKVCQWYGRPVNQREADCSPGNHTSWFVARISFHPLPHREMSRSIRDSRRASFDPLASGVKLVNYLSARGASGRLHTGFRTVSGENRKRPFAFITLVSLWRLVAGPKDGLQDLKMDGSARRAGTWLRAFEPGHFSRDAAIIQYGLGVDGQQPHQRPHLVY